MYRFSSRLGDGNGISSGRVTNESDSRVAALVDFLVQGLKASPRVKVVPKVVEGLYLVLGRIHRAKARHGLLLGEPGFPRKDRAKDVAVFLGRDGLGVGNVVFDRRVDRVELTSSLGVEQGLESLLDALEKVVVVCARRARGLFVGVVSEDLSSV